MTATMREATASSPLDRTQPSAASAPGKPGSASAERERLLGVDAARGVALLGMIAVHSLYESDEAGRPTWSFLIFGGRAAAAFAVLAGIGIAFTTGRRQVPLAAGRHTAMALGARALLIGAIGLALGYTDPGLGQVILPYYAVMFLLVIPLVFLPNWAIAAIGVASAVGMPALSHVLRPHLPKPSLVNPTVGHIFDQPVGLLTELSLTGFYPALPWMTYLCAGLVIGRLDLTQAKVAVRLLATGSILAALASATSSILLNQFGGRAHIHAAQSASGLTPDETAVLLTHGGNGTSPTSTWWWLAVDAPHTNTPFSLLSTTGSAIGLLGVVLLASRITRPLLRRLARIVLVPLAGVGAMTLTLYTAHLIFINSEWDSYAPTTGCLIQVATALLIGLTARVTVGRGPLEGLVTAVANRFHGAHRPSVRDAAEPSLPTSEPSLPTAEPSLPISEPSPPTAEPSRAKPRLQAAEPKLGTNAESALNGRPAAAEPPQRRPVRDVTPANSHARPASLNDHTDARSGSPDDHTDAQPASPDDSATRSHNLAIEIVIDPPGQVRLLIKGDQISTA